MLWLLDRDRATGGWIPAGAAGCAASGDSQPPAGAAVGQGWPGVGQTEATPASAPSSIFGAAKHLWAHRQGPPPRLAKN
jgi:hypothetical protein